MNWELYRGDCQIYSCDQPITRHCNLWLRNVYVGERLVERQNECMCSSGLVFGYVIGYKKRQAEI